MALDLRDCSFFGPALPEPFVKFQLEAELVKRKLLPKSSGEEGRALDERWEVYRRKLRSLGEQGGDRRVAAHVLEPLVERLGYTTFARQDTVITREGPEDGGWLCTDSAGCVLRAWAVDLGTDLDAPARRGRAYRFSPSRVAERVLLAKNERVGLLTDGEELRLLLCDPARPDSHVAVRLDRSGGWRASRATPDSYRLLLALASPGGVAALPDLADAARLAQSIVTRKLRVQARRAVEGFLQEVLDHPRNAGHRLHSSDSAALARDLWREGLILVYRLLFVFKLESSADPARAFSFAATSLWRNTYSPNTALAPLVRKIIDDGADTGGYLEQGLRTLWRMFADGMSSSELEIKPLGGMLFGRGTTPLLDRLQWGERAVARLLDALLWTPRDGRAERERVHYGSLDVEDLGRVYEALLELEPGITTEPMCRLRRAKLEVVVPMAQGDAYRTGSSVASDGEEQDDADESETSVQFIEEIPEGRFFLRVGLGRKATGSYYTPHPFVRFLVQETLGPQIAERSPKEDPHPERLLELKVLDPAMGSGHFLVEACRYLGDALYEACRLCDELSIQADEQAAKRPEPKREALLAHAADLRRRVEVLPDPDDELVAYLPSRVPEGEASGLSQKKAEALCRRLAAVHCLYGVDKNPLAVELAKLSLWLESYAEGLPLTFMDHRLVCGNSLTGPFFEHLLTFPKSGAKLDDLFAQNLSARLQSTLADALVHVRDLEVSVGKDQADLEQKSAAKAKLDEALKPLKLMAAAWSGGVMLGDQCDDAAYRALAEAVGEGKATDATFAAYPKLAEMASVGREGVTFDLVFPEVFAANDGERRGFDGVIGNPPWDAIQFKSKEFLAAFDLRILDAPTKRERTEVEERLLADSGTATLFAAHQEDFERLKRANDRLYRYQKVIIDGDLAGRQLDAFRVFMERNAQLTRAMGLTGVVVPSAFHANAGATGVRQLYLEKMALQCCFSFENRKKLFDIHRSFKFAAVVAKNDAAGTKEFDCGFYWHELERLFDEDAVLRYSLGMLRRIGGSFLNLPELGDKAASELLAKFARGSALSVGEYLDASRIQLRMTELHTSHDAERFEPLPDNLPDPRTADGAVSLLERGRLVLMEGKGFHQFDSKWGEHPRYSVPLSQLMEKPNVLRPAQFVRMAFRKIARSNDERTVIAAAMPSGTVFADSTISEMLPEYRAAKDSLCLMAIVNCYAFDWFMRQKVSANVNVFLLRQGLLPRLGIAAAMVTHSALRLSCNHAGYAPLWEEQVGDAWREPKPKHAWPVLEGDNERWAVRAAIDAVVADAYGLDRAQYEHVLSTFSHKSYPKAPERCLAAFDELKAIGPEAFTKNHDPYWDIPLNESLPKPVIDLPIPDDAHEDGAPGQASLFDGAGGDSVSESARSGAKPKRAAGRRKKPSE